MISIRSFLRFDNPFDYIIVGFIIKLFSGVLQLAIPYQIADATCGTICWIFVIKGFLLIKENLKFPFSGFYAFLVKFFLVLCFILIVRGYLIDYNYIWYSTSGAINYHLFQPTYIICYLMPFVALIPVRYYNFRLVCRYLSLFVLITIIASLIYRQEIMQASLLGAMGIELEDIKSASSLAFCSQFVVLSLFYKFLPRRIWLMSLVAVIVCLLLMVIGARRGGTLTYIIFLFGSLFFYSSTKAGGSKLMSRLFVILCLFVFGMIIMDSSISSFLQERGLEDTRTNVEEAMLEQMSPWELFVGKGLNGRYYCPLKIDDYLDGWRYVVETGFYNLVLKGGYLLACTYILLLIIPMYKGWFRSNNLFCKAGSYFILYHLITQKTFGLLSFNLSFFFLWMMIVCCMNKEIREMDNDEIIQNFFYNI